MHDFFWHSLVTTYAIHYSGLPEGEHHFSFEVDKALFEAFGAAEYQEVGVHVEVRLTKAATHLRLDFDLKGSVKVVCDRCLGLLDLPVAASAQLVVKFGEQSSDVSDVDEVLWLAYDEHTLALEQHLYDYISLSLPVRRVHDDLPFGQSACSEEMLNLLDRFTPQNEAPTDPRWDALKNALN